MKKYYDEITDCIIDDGIAVPRNNSDISSLPTWSTSPEFIAQELQRKVFTERAWRNSEIDLISFKINDLEDRGKDASALRAYRIVLRDYPQQPDFPNGTRPTLQ